jgi:hypothetical protein
MFRLQPASYAFVRRRPIVLSAEGRVANHIWTTPARIDASNTGHHQPTGIRQACNVQVYARIRA